MGKNINTLVFMAVAGWVSVLFLGSFTAYRESKHVLELQNAWAANDTTRKLLDDTKDSVAVYAQLAFQRKVALDAALDKGAKAERARAVATAGVKIAVPARQQHSTTPVETAAKGPGHDNLAAPGGEQGAGPAGLAASLQLTEPPVVGSIRVRVWPDSAAWDTQLQPAPLHVKFALACGAKGVSVLVRVPDWAQATVDSGVVDPHVCAKRRSHFLRDAGIGAGLATTLFLIFGIGH